MLHPRPIHFRDLLNDAKRIVIKIGTAVITDKSGAPALQRLRGIINDINGLRGNNKDVIVVASGAVALGARQLGVEVTRSVALKQACAAVGQKHVMTVFGDAAEAHGINTAQILVTTDDFTDRNRYLSLRNTIGKLLEIGVLPIVNENDTTSTQTTVRQTSISTRRSFDDNDRLSALVASKMDADLLLILTDVDGLYTTDPHLASGAQIIPTVNHVTPKIAQFGGGARAGRGGMKTKLEAAKVATRSDCATLIVNGTIENIVARVFAGEELGTIFPPLPSLSKRKRWIAFATSIEAAIIVNNGARQALVDGKASLLPVGVINVRGVFERGDVVSILGEDNEEFARGIVNYASETLGKIVGWRSEKVIALMDIGRDAHVISRDDIALLQESHA